MPTLVAASGIDQRNRAKHSRGDHALKRERKRDKRAGNGSGARAAVGLDHVAIEPHGALAESLQIGDRAQRAADHALNFERASRLASARRFARRALFGRARQHAVLAGDPAFAGAFQKRGNAVFHRGGDDHARVARFDQHAAFGVVNKIRNDFYRAQIVVRASINSQNSSLFPLLGPKQILFGRLV